MKDYVYVGPTANIGRFGVVTTGTLLRLTERELATVHQDRRFIPADRYKQPTKELDGRENDPEYVRRLEWIELPYAELRERAKAMGLFVHPRTPHRVLLRAVLSAVKHGSAESILHRSASSGGTAEQ